MDILEGKTILVIDDDPNICDLVERTLTRAGARVCHALDGEDGLRQFDASQPDLVILDIMMPAPDGFEVCSRILSRSQVPIVFLTALGQDQDVVRGLELGAVDYIVKPFSPKVLTARAGAALRRVVSTTADEARVAPDNGFLTIDVERRAVWVRGIRVHLTPTEYRLLIYLLDNANRLVPAGEILHHIWGPGYSESANYVHVYISRLRSKLEPNPQRPQYLRSEHGVGYCLVLPGVS